MRKLGLWAVGPKPDTSCRIPRHKGVSVSAAADLNIERPNHVWATDITCHPHASRLLPVCHPGLGDAQVLSPVSRTNDRRLLQAALDNRPSRT